MKSIRRNLELLKLLLPRSLSSSEPIVHLFHVAINYILEIPRAFDDSEVKMVYFDTQRVLQQSLLGKFSLIC
jgi:hypothetical protein